MRAHWQYLKYVLRHKWYVFQACLHYGLFWQGITHDWSKFLPSEWNPYVEYFYGLRVGARVGGVADNYGWDGVIIEEREPRSQGDARWKVRDEKGHEWWVMPYEIDRREEIAAFDTAWNHHQKRQPHHWQYWLLLCDDGTVAPLPMPDKYRKEMIADWRGAGRAITGKDETPEWYAKNRDKMQLRPDTRAWVESQLGVQSA